MCVINPYDLKLIGDVDGDGKINIRDATKIQLYLSEIIELDDRQEVSADVNNDGEINIADATDIQKYSAQMISTLG